jgi:hypothetical protein
MHHKIRTNGLLILSQTLYLTYIAYNQQLIAILICPFDQILILFTDKFLPFIRSIVWQGLGWVCSGEN